MWCCIIERRKKPMKNPLQSAIHINYLCPGMFSNMIGFCCIVCKVSRSKQKKVLQNNSMIVASLFATLYEPSFISHAKQYTTIYSYAHCAFGFYLFWPFFSLPHSLSHVEDAVGFESCRRRRCQLNFKCTGLFETDAHRKLVSNC